MLAGLHKGQGEMRPGPECYPCSMLTESGECMAARECAKGHWHKDDEESWIGEPVDLEGMACKICGFEKKE